MRSQHIVATLAVTALVCAILIAGAQWRRSSAFPGAFRAVAPPQASESNGSESLFDSESHLPVCAFWQPWRDLVAPGEPRTYLDRIKRRLEEPSTRSGDYLGIIERARGVTDGGSEAVCIMGRFAESGVYHLEALENVGCYGDPAAFLESNLAINVERLEAGGFINDIHLAVGLEDVEPAAVLPFFLAQQRLMAERYGGWSRAFPAYAALNRAGFGPTSFAKDDQERINMRFAWLSQAMLHWLPGWARYLLQLSDLVVLRTRIEGEAGERFLEAGISTVDGGIEVTLLPAAKAALEAGVAMPLAVVHDIIVRFRGLVIELSGLRFQGTFVPEPGSLEYSGRFTGLDDFKMSGAYRGLRGGPFGDMIFKLVREAVQKEVERLVSGNRGRGWTFKLAHERQAQANVFVYQTSFQSPVNFLNLLREDKDTTGSPVLPDQGAIADLNRWATQSVDALIEDFAAQGACGP